MEGYLGLFSTAFLAATILPFSSEAVLAGLIAFDRYDPWLLWLAASSGNTLGALLNWFLGRFCLHWQDHRWFPDTPGQLMRAQSWFKRHGVWSLLLAWVPVVGDPLTFAAGLMRVNVWLFLVLVAMGKAGRYAVVLTLAQGVF